MGLIHSVEDPNKVDPSLLREFSSLMTSKLEQEFFLVLELPIGLEIQTSTLALQIFSLQSLHQFHKPILNCLSISYHIDSAFLESTTYISQFIVN